jgi:hypothetical protein
MLPPFGNFSGQEIVDGEGFAPPAGFGGTLAVKYNTMAYTDTTAKNLFSLPKGAIIVAWIVNITTAFNSSGTDLLDIGKTGTAAEFADDLDVSATGQIPNGYVPGKMFTPLTEDTQVIGTFVQSVADASAGAATVACIYMIQ